MQHDRRSVIWVVMVALCAAVLGPVPEETAQTDEPPDPPNVRKSLVDKMADSPFEVPVEASLVQATYNIRSALPSVVPSMFCDRPADPNAFSWQVDLGICGGTLIARDWVLTAAHCLREGMHDFGPGGLL